MVEFEEVAVHSSVHISRAFCEGGDNCRDYDFLENLKMGILDVTVKLSTVAAYKIANGKYIEDDKGPKNQALRDTMVTVVVWALQLLMER